ncbi:MAG TPA: glycosyl hydrolase [Firmicutes bacterium]|nr:glycosyl hydrolase [Bacillota bacterium]
MEDISKLLKELSIDEKAALLAGTDFMFTNPIQRLDIPQIRMSDGPHGLRVQGNNGDNGVNGSEPATSFPTACLTACGWNEDNLFKMGKAMGEEARFYNIDVILGPGVNIKRNPLAGRNFEYFSEDPLLAGKMGSAEIKGIQSEGVGACIKHFALNNAENYRFMGDSVADERAIREIYLKPFEIAIKTSNPEALMCAYNKINGTYCSQNKWLLTDILRNEWGFNGLTMTDWGATHNRIAMLQAGLDLEMPGDTSICRKWIVDGVANGKLDEASLDKAIINVLNLVAKHKERKIEKANFSSHDLLAEEIAEDCAVLMKNDGVLPLSSSGSFFVVGELFEKMRYQGSGSSLINPTFLTTPKKAFDNAKVKYKYCKGYKENQIAVDKTLIEETVKNAKEYDTILAFIGLTDYVESEGSDRDNMSLPPNQLSLINALVKEGKKIVVVFYGGSPVELPFANEVSAILNMYLPGQRGGEATRKLLFGEKNPCGKLAETWIKSYLDVPYGNTFSKTQVEVYKESIFVGYRYYQRANKEVAFPFGFGLSYTSFDYSNYKIEESDDLIIVKATIKNIGNCFGAEVVELYVKSPKTNIFKPEKELHGFTKVYLKPGESKNITINFSKKDLAYFNLKEKRYIVEKGEYEIQLCSDCQTVKLANTISIAGENNSFVYDKDILETYTNSPGSISDEVFEKMSGFKIPSLPLAKPITLESRFSDLEKTFIGKILHNAVLSVAKKDMKKAKKLKEGVERDNKIKGALFLKRILESNSIITMSMSAGKTFPYNFAQGFVDLANGHLIKGIKDFCSPIKTLPLPKNQIDNNKE